MRTLDQLQYCEKLILIKEMIVVSMLGNVSRTVWKMCTLILGFKELKNLLGILWDRTPKQWNTGNFTSIYIVGEWWEVQN